MEGNSLNIYNNSPYLSRSIGEVLNNEDDLFIILFKKLCNNIGLTTKSLYVTLFKIFSIRNQEHCHIRRFCAVQET